MGQEKREHSCYCIHLRRAANGVSQFYDSFLAPTGLSVNQFSLLLNLERLGSGSVSDLAHYVGLERTTLVRTLRPLLERGLITDAAETGRRSRDLRLTEAGRRAVDQGLPLWERAQAEISRRLGPEGAETLHQLLDALTDE